MATRSRIAHEYGDGSIRSIYCHWDGYPLHNGDILAKHYRTADEVDKLIELGDLSILGEVIGVQHDFNWNDNMTFEERNNDPRNKMCLSFLRDRGEKDCIPMCSHTRQELVDYFNDSDQEYLYLFSRNGYWLMWEDGKWKPLLLILIREELAKANEEAAAA